jgi:hypothetical protein
MPMAIALPLTLTSRCPSRGPADGAGLRGERLVGLDQVEIADAPAGLLSAARGRDRPGARSRRQVRPGDDARQRRLAALGGLAAVISTTAAALSLMPEALAAVTLFLVEGRPSLDRPRVTPALGYPSVSTTTSPLRDLMSPTICP